MQIAFFEMLLEDFFSPGVTDQVPAHRGIVADCWGIGKSFVVAVEGGRGLCWFGGLGWGGLCGGRIIIAKTLQSGEATPHPACFTNQFLLKNPHQPHEYQSLRFGWLSWQVFW